MKENLQLVLSRARRSDVATHIKRKSRSRGVSSGKSLKSNKAATIQREKVRISHLLPPLSVKRHPPLFESPAAVIPSRFEDDGLATVVHVGKSSSDKRIYVGRAVAIVLRGPNLDPEWIRQALSPAQGGEHSQILRFEPV